MGFLFSDYKVDIKDVGFRTTEGRTFAKTAVVTFTSPDQEKTSVENFGYIEPEEVYKWIDAKQAINLNECYVDHFSLSEYRISRELEKKKHIDIPGFSAKGAFFDSAAKIDMSYIRFGDGNIDFEQAIFAKGLLSFNSTNFGDGHISFAYALFRNGNVDFANTVFGTGDVNFKNCVFHNGTKDFQYADFGSGNVSFVNTEFGDGDVTFINTVFHDGDVTFKVARFGTGKVDFHFAKFGNGDIVFERTEFGNGRVDFRTAEFNHGRINFNRAVFGDGDISFEGSELKSGKFMFKRANLGSGSFSFEQAEFANAELYLDGTDFGSGTISFYNSKFKLLSLRSCHLDNYLDLRCQQAEYVDLSDTVARDIIDIMPYEVKVNISILNLTGMRLIGQIYIDWELNKVQNIIENQQETGLRNKAEQFRILKQNFNATGHYNDEDKAYVEFKRYESLADLEESMRKKPVSALWQYPVYWFKWLIFDKIGLYATAPGRVLVSVLVSWFIFGTLFFLIQLAGLGNTTSSVGNPDKLSALAQSFYHSAITFFTIGYGDVFPQGMSRVLSALEGFMGVFMMSYFTVAFVRKVLR
jgi:hypothetical protein